MLRSLVFVLCVYFSIVGRALATANIQPLPPSPFASADIESGYLHLIDDVEVGDFYDATFGYSNPGPPTHPSYYVLGIASVTGSPNFTVLEDNCAGTVLYTSGGCVIKVRIAPAVKGALSVKYSLPFTGVHPDSSSFSGVVNTKLEGFGVINNLKADDPNPPAGVKQECSKGSIVRIDAQSLGEHIPIVGTDLFLSYSTEFAESYQTDYFLPQDIPYFNQTGWTISVHHFYDRFQHRLFFGTGTSEFTKNTKQVGNNTLVVSSDGSEVYVFDSDGRHLETLFGLTGSVKYRFLYQSGNMGLDSIEDAYGNQTLVTPVYGSYSIISYGGKTTSISVNAQGLVSSVTNPNGETYLMTYKPGTDLLQSFTKPGGQSTTFTYSSSGRLTKDLSAAGNFWQLTESLQATRREVSKSSQMGRISTTTNRHESGISIRESISPFGYMEKSSSELNGYMFSEERPDESVLRYTGIDSRLSAPVYTSFLQVVKGTTPKQTNITRTYVPATPSSYFSYDSMTESATTDGRTTTRVYNKNTKTAVTTSPAGVITTEVFNSFENLVSFKLGNDTPFTYSYDSRGRISGSAQGSFNTITNTYNGSGFLASTTNARNETTTFDYDLAGRVTQVTRPDATAIGYSYDANGNMIGITPPGRLQHVFEFNLMELLSKYDPPALSGVAVTETQYNYNLDRQLTSVVRPDMQSILYTYGSSTGLLEKVTIARGDNELPTLAIVT